MSAMPPLVVKIGGSVIHHLGARWWDDAATVCRQQKVIFVHGWSQPLREMQVARGRSPVFLIDQNGYRSRFTDSSVIGDIQQVSAELCRLVEAKLVARGITVRCLDGARDRLLDAEVSQQRWWVGHELRPLINMVGPLRRVDTAAILAHLEHVDALVVTPLARSASQPHINVDADRAAAKIAAAVRARALVMVTDVDGVDIGGRPARELARTSAASLTAEISGGMRKKINAASGAIDAGVRAVSVGRAPVTELVAGRAGTQVIEA